MKLADAPPPGWYPDPEWRRRLRWWDGTDWTDHRRAMPSEAELAAVEALVGAATQASDRPAPPAPAPPGAGFSRADADELLTQVRQAARSEVDRAADLFSQRAEAATRQLQPLVTEATSRVLRLIRIAAIIAVVIVVGWILFQVLVQASFFEWIGDRIDNLSDNS